MAFQMRRGLPLAALILLLSFGVVFAAPAVARADSLSWTRTYSGPPNIPPTSSLDEIDVAAALNAVSFAPASAQGWAVGVYVRNVSQTGGTRCAFVASTVNGGADLTPIILNGTPSIPYELHGVVARSAGEVWAVGDNGTILKSNGLVWTQMPLTGWTPGKALRAIAFSKSDPLVGWAVGDGYGVAMTTDGGFHWATPVVPGASGALRAVCAAGAGAYAVGDTSSGTGSAIMKHLDASGGSTAKSVGGSALFGVAFADAANGWAVGADATFVRTINSGSTWSTVAGIPRLSGTPVEANALRAIAFADAYSGVAVGKYQGVWRTVDGGAHWVVDPLEDGSSGWELRGAGFAAGDAGRPVAVGRPYDTQLTQGTQKARAYRGTWERPDETAPTTVSDAQSDYLGPATITLTATDSGGSGVAHTYYRLDNAQSNTEGTIVHVSSAGSHTLEFWSVDAAPNSPNVETPHKTATFTITLPDTAAPTTASDARTSYEDSATITLDPTDSGSGVAHTYYRLDGGTQVEGLSVAVSGEGGHSLEFWSVDVAGNVETPHKTKSFTITIPDRIAPVTISDATGREYAGPVTINLTATDNPGGSGVAHTYYVLDGNTRAEGPSVLVTGDGAHTLRFWSVDVAENVEPAKTVTVSIATPVPPDSTDPVTTSDAVSGYTDSATIKLTATDSGSGVAHTYYRLDDAPSGTEGTTVQVHGAGSHTLEFWSVDVAGNVELPHKTRTFTITVPDRIAPVTGSDAQISYVAAATIHLTATDAGGVAHTYYKLDDGPQTAGTTIVVALAGMHTVEFWSVDDAGNVETPHKSATFLVSAPPDTTAPTTLWQGYASSYATKASIVLVATDAGSGVAHTYYKLDGNTQVEGSSLSVTAGGTHTLEYWSVDMAGNPESRQSGSFTVVLPLASVYIPHGPSHAHHGRSFTVYGYLIPRHAAHSHPIKLAFYRYKSGHYVWYKTLNPKVENITYKSHQASKYSFTTSLPYAGKWRIRAVHEDSGHRASYSGYDYFRVY